MGDTIGAELLRELSTLEGERKMDKVALKGVQWQLSEKLNGEMGRDMDEVLSGRKLVKFSLWHRIRNFFDRILWHLT